MSLLYSDLPDEPAEAQPQRRRLETLVGLVAVVGAGLAGTAVVGDLFGTRRPTGNEWGRTGPSEPALPPEGIERRVGPSTLAATAVGVAPETEYGPVVDAVPVPEPLPTAGAETRVVSVEPPPGDPTPPPPRVEEIVLAPIEPVEVVTPTITEAPASTVAPVPVPAPAPMPPSAEPAAAVLQLARTAGFTVTAQMRETVANLGLEGWVDEQLTPGLVPDQRVDALTVDFDLLDVDGVTLRASGAGPAALSQARWDWIARLLVGERQLHDQMATMWRELFAVHADPADLADLDQVIRARALGPYAELLGGVVDSAAMRQAFDLGSEPTVNDFVDSGLARRLLESFTLGHAAGFAELEVRAVAEGLARSVSETISELCSRPNTANHIVSMVSERLLGSRVPAAVVAAALHGYAATGGNVGETVKAVLIGGVGAGDPGRTRRGDLWLVAALRSLGADVTIGGEWNPGDGGTIAGMLRTLGAEPGAGRPSDDSDWETPAAVQARWTVARRLVGGGGADVSIDLAGVNPGTPLPAAAVVNEIAGRMGVPLGEGDLSGLLAYLGLDADDLVMELSSAAIADLVALVLVFPAFQRFDGGRT